MSFDTVLYTLMSLRNVAKKDSAGTKRGWVVENSRLYPVRFLESCRSKMSRCLLVERMVLLDLMQRTATSGFLTCISCIVLIITAFRLLYFFVYYCLFSFSQRKMHSVCCTEKDRFVKLLWFTFFAVVLVIFPSLHFVSFPLMSSSLFVGKLRSMYVLKLFWNMCHIRQNNKINNNRVNKYLFNNGKKLW